MYNYIRISESFNLVFLLSKLSNTVKGQTKIEFILIDDLRVNYVSNNALLEELSDIIDNEKYVIIDLSIQRTIKAVKGSLKYGW